MFSKKFFHHLPHYLPIVGVYMAGLMAFVLFSFDRQFQVGVAIAVAASHVVWGIVHHHIHKDLSLEIVIEYLAVATIGLVLLLSVILRS